MCMAAAGPSTVRVMVFLRLPSPPFFYFMPTDLVGGAWEEGNLQLCNSLPVWWLGMGL